MNLSAVILSLVEVFTRRDGTPIYVEHFRERGAQVYAETVAAMLSDAAELVEVDVAILTSLAYHETGFRDVATPAGIGILQVHPRNRFGRGCKRDCRHADELACLWAGVKWGALAWRDARTQCGGDQWSAVGYYRTGACVQGPRSRRVVDLGKRIRRSITTGSRNHANDNSHNR